MAISTIGTYIGFASSAAGPFIEYFQMFDYPDFSSTPDTIDATTMADKEEVLLQGLKRQQQMEFTAPYDANTYHELDAMSSKNVCIMFSDKSCFTTYGAIDVTPIAGNVNDVVKMRVTLTRKQEWALSGKTVSGTWKPSTGSRTYDSNSKKYQITITEPSS